MIHTFIQPTIYYYWKTMVKLKNVDEGACICFSNLAIACSSKIVFAWLIEKYGEFVIIKPYIC